MWGIRSAVPEKTGAGQSCELRASLPPSRVRDHQCLVIACFFAGCLPAVFAYAGPGAYGPYLTIVSNLPSLPRQNQIPPPPLSSNPSTFQVNPANDQAITAAILPVPASPSSATPALNTSFYSAPNIDMSAATNGTYIFDETSTIYDMSGNVIQSNVNLFCGSNPIPECAYGGFVGDPRIYYDLVGQRWIFSGIWVFGSNEPPTVNVLAVSQTSDPTGAWNKYQYLACGPTDTLEGSDQPHMGFNNQWIVVNSLCTVADNGYSLQVFDKQNLFGGGTLNLGTNWFEFQDQVTNDDGRLDNPVATYVSDAVERLTHGHVKKNGEYQVVYSHITGATDSPVYTPDTASTTIANFTGLSNNLAPAQAPSCTTDCSIQPSCCISSLVSGWVHSSGVYSDLNGNEVLVSANVSGWTAHSNTNVAEYVVENLSTNNSYASIVGSAGTGILGAEITAPTPGQIQANHVYTIWASSAPNFYPGFQYYLWNYYKNTLDGSGSFQGIDVPPPGSFEANRWLDFMTAAVPIPGQNAALFNGPIAIPAAGESCTTQTPNCESTFWYSD